MLQIYQPNIQLWDEKTEQFLYINGCDLKLEHSLLSISKWESITKTYFLGKQHSIEDLQLYAKCMLIEPIEDENIFNYLSLDNIKAIKDYIKDVPTATVINSSNNAKSSGTFVTSELIYYWMISANVPFSCETWNIHRLLTLLEVCASYNNPKKKSTEEVLMSQAELNRQRRLAMHSKG